MRFVTLFFCGILVSVPGLAQEGEYTVSVKKKAKDKYENRWTLADWFETKRKSRLQDMWLAGQVSRSPYEFLLGADTGTLEAKVNGASTSQSYQSLRGHAAAYASLAGLEGAYIDQKELGKGWDAQFNLRLLGDAIQQSGLTLSYGVRNREITDGTTQAKEIFQNSFGQAQVSIYVTRFLGFDGSYRMILQQNTDQGAGFEGNQVEAAGYIDFSFFRPYVGWTRETTTTERVGVKTETVIEGYNFGLKVFF